MPSPSRKPQRHTKVHMPCEERSRDLGACRSQVFLVHPSDPRIGNTVDELPQAILDAAAQLPGKPASLILLLVNVAEGRFYVGRRDTDAAADHWNAASRTERSKAVRDIAEQEVETM